VLTPNAIRALERGKQPPSPAVIARFLASHSFPIVENGRTTFVFQGRAESVRLVHRIFGLESTQGFARVGSSDLWYLTLELPDRSRIEYKFEVEDDGQRRLIQDPLNPLRAHDPFGSNSVLQTTGYEVPEWTLPDPTARVGALDELSVASSAFESERRVTLYLPARFSRRRTYPLLIVHDGGDFLNYAGLKTVLDNLMHRLEIPPMIVALTHPVERLVEYADNEAHAHFLVKELVPRLSGELPLIDEPSSRGLMGASFGAVASLAAAWRYPHYFGRLLLLSGSFAFTDVGNHSRSAAFDPVVGFVNSFRKRPLRVSDRVFMACGVFESLIYENRSLVPVLQAAGMNVRFVEARDGHNWECWRDRLREGLSWLFPGPLWKVYE
jgi:enterochelin esterase-like enzyme